MLTKSIMQFLGESLLFAIDPKMSYVSKEFAAGDPEFWTPKPAARKTSAA